MEPIKYQITWTQEYVMWEPTAWQRTESEPEITDFTEAREVLARIMAK